MTRKLLALLAGVVLTTTLALAGCAQEEATTEDAMMMEDAMTMEEVTSEEGTTEEEVAAEEETETPAEGEEVEAEAAAE
jgi:outer membrane lipoprotein SlyB